MNRRLDAEEVVCKPRLGRYPRLVNLTVEAMIATPKHIEAMYGARPEGARKAIEKRDAEKS